MKKVVFLFLCLLVNAINISAQKKIPLKISRSSTHVKLNAKLNLNDSITTHTIYVSKIEQYQLQNGLTVILAPDDQKNDVFGMIVVKTGSKNDPKDATGLAHYQEHMLFKGTSKIGTTNWEAEKPHIEKIFELYDQLGKAKTEDEKKSIQNQINEESIKAGKYQIPNEFERLLKSIGSTNINAFTSYDQTAYFNSFPSNQIERWLELNYHRFTDPVFRLFQSELEVVYEEKNLYNDNFIFTMLEEFQKHFFKNHPYGQQTIIGTTEHLKNPSLTKMYEFFKTYYVPNNMALILCGNFDPEETKPLIEKYFGQLEKKEIPKFPIYQEEDFKGREFVTAKLSPIRIGFLGYRTVPLGHQDEEILKVINLILSNKNQTGLLDKLVIENKLLAATHIPMNLLDHGGSYFLFVPQLVGQKFETAETLVREQIKKLVTGEFDDWLLEAAKNQLYVDFKLETEKNTGLALELMKAFLTNKKPAEYLNFPQRIKNITKQDVINIAKKYFSDNYLVFYSKMGFPKKEKLKKPDYKPIIPEKDASSQFAKEFYEKDTLTIKYKFIDFKKDIYQQTFPNGTILYVVNNLENDIFTFKIRFKTGNIDNPSLKYVAELMNYAGTDSLKFEELRKQLSIIGSSINFSYEEPYFNIELTGIEKNITEAIQILTTLLKKPKIENDKLKILINAEKGQRKMEKEPDIVAQALIEYVLFQNKSKFLNRLSLKEISKIKTDTIDEFFYKFITQYPMEIHYVGQLEISRITKIAELVNNSIPKLKVIKEISYKEPVKYNENLVYLTNHKKSIQSKIYLTLNCDKYDITKDAIINVFNQYFSGSFSGLVLQEIREYRSLAYNAYAFIKKPEHQRGYSYLYGYVGTQADKTIEAMEVYTNLIKSMPEKPERIEKIKRYLLQEMTTNKPHFRDLSEQISLWQNLGFNDDPAKLNFPQIEKLTFETLKEFYKNYIQPQPIIFVITGDKKRIDTKSLNKFGKIVKINHNKLFK